MANILELAGSSHVFTLKDGSTFRIKSRERKTVKDSLISDELMLAQKMNLIMITSIGAVANKKEG